MRSTMRLAIVLDCLDPKALAPFWCDALGYELVGSLPDYEVLAPVRPVQGPTLILQQVVEPPTAKNRMHLDLHPPLDLGVPAVVARLEERGGRRIGEPHLELLGSLGIWWQQMQDPEGNVFDVVADAGHPAPAP